MTFPIQVLKEILDKPTSVDGVVSSVTGGLVRVATSKGVLTARVVGVLNVGDRARVEAGVATFLSKPSRVYSV